jgi:hypothetical protein
LTKDRKHEITNNNFKSINIEKVISDFNLHVDYPKLCGKIADGYDKFENAEYLVVAMYFFNEYVFSDNLYM